MRIFRDIVTGDEMFSDIYTMKLSSTGIFYEVDGTLVTRSSEKIDDKVFGGNASAEGPGESFDDPNAVSGVDIVLNHKLQEIDYNRDTYKSYLKEYMKTIRDRLKVEDPGRVDAFMAGAQAELKKIWPRLKDCQYFTGESVNTQAMVAVLDYRDDDTPYMLFYKDGLVEEKC